MSVSFIRESLITTSINERELTLTTQSNVISTQVNYYMNDVRNEANFNFLRGLIKDQSIKMNSRIILADPEGNVIVDSLDTMKDDNIIQIPTVINATNGFTSSKVFATNDGKRIMYMTTSIIRENERVGLLFISSDLSSAIASVDATIDKIFVVFIIALLLSAIISIVIGEIFANPIERLTDTVRNMTMGKPHQKLRIEGNDELSELGNAFNIMAMKLEQVESKRKKFVSNVSHELRTPMTSMKIVADSLLSSDTWDEAVYREFLGDINSEVDRLNRIIDSLLYLVKIDKSEMPLSYSVTYINMLINRISKTLSPLAEDQNVKIIIRRVDRFQVEIDQEKIQQCIINIVGNAIKYNVEGGYIYIDAYKSNNELVIVVEDTGLGIPKKALDQIFDRFYRVDEHRNRKTGGTGLGLSIADEIVRLHQGYIDVQSEVGKGTTMTVHLPLSQLNPVV